MTTSYNVYSRGHDRNIQFLCGLNHLNSMHVFSDVGAMKKLLSQYREHAVDIGLAPTMGALHEGHISLVKAMTSRNELAVVSIFVNPKQFNETSDLEKYPRTLHEDLIKLEKAGCQVVFIPTVDEIYPKMLDTTIEMDIEHLIHVLEGEHRPGHFEGMMEVINRFLHIVQPDNIYVGQKDFQQYTIIRNLCERHHPKTGVIMCPIIREPSGLAKSSRNVRLTAEWKQKALVLSETLKYAKEQLNTLSLAEIHAEAEQRIADQGLRLEYFSIIDGITLAALEEEKKYKIIVAVLAAWGGEVRLIDNMILFDNFHKVN